MNLRYINDNRRERKTITYFYYFYLNYLITNYLQLNYLL